MIAFHAAVWLKDFADAIDESQRGLEPAAERQQILGELRGLYAKALKRPPLIETVVEAAPSRPEASCEPDSSSG